MNIEPIKLLRGSHEDTGTTGQGCFMNVIAYLNGEPQITDRSPCVCFVMRPLLISANDLFDDKTRQLLIPFIFRAMGSRTDDSAEISRRLSLVVEFAEVRAKFLVGHLGQNAYLEMKDYAKRYANYPHAWAFASIAATQASNVVDWSSFSCNPADDLVNDLLSLFDACLPPASEPTAAHIQRAQELIELAA